LPAMASGRSQFKESISNCFGVIKSSPPVLSVLIYLEFYISFMITLFALIGYSIGVQILPLLLMAALQTAIAVPGYLYMMWNEPKYILVFALVQFATFITEFFWAIVKLTGVGNGGISALLIVLSILQLSNVVVAFFFRDLRVDFCCCGKNRRACGLNNVSLEGGLTPPPANWAKTKPAPSLSTSEKKSDKKTRKSAFKNALRHKKNLDVDVEGNPSKNGTAHSPLEKNIFGGISEEEKERAMQKRLSRMPVHTPSRSMTRSPDEVRVEPGSSLSDRENSGRRVTQKGGPKEPKGSKKDAGIKKEAGSTSSTRDGSRERTSSESLRQTSVRIK
ncbi:hypothetical protein PENTCL1PPCAC_1739, partial [Pristionchus entomophagus]